MEGGGGGGVACLFDSCLSCDVKGFLGKRFSNAGFVLETVSSGPLSIRFGPFRIELRISPQIFVNIRNDPSGILMGPEKKIENLVSDSLNISELRKLL